MHQPYFVYWYVRFRVWNTSSFVILTAAYLIQPYFVYTISGTRGRDRRRPRTSGRGARAMLHAARARASYWRVPTGRGHEAATCPCVNGRTAGSRRTRRALGLHFGW
jgi:hypothetical protein